MSRADISPRTPRPLQTSLWFCAKRAIAPLARRIRNRHLFAWDVATQPLVIVAAFSLRLERFLPPNYTEQIYVYGLLTALVLPLVYYAAGMYRRFWRYASSDEAELIAIASAIGTLVTAVIIYGALVPLGALPSVPRSIPFIAAMLSTMAAALPRYAIRIANRYRSLASKTAPGGESARVLIAGAGDAGHAVLRELQANPQLGYAPVGLVDDDPTKHGLILLGCEVLGSTEAIPALSRKHRIDRLIVAMPSAPGSVIRRITALAAEARLPVLTLPGVYELISGDVSISRLRSVRVEDLLRREPVEIDRSQVQALLRDRTVLVTGGGGSIGSEICRQVAACQPARLVILGHGENSVYQIGQEIARQHRRPPLVLAIADIRDRSRLDEIFRLYPPDVVLHAAAHKHVPLMEENMPDAVSNNIRGTLNVVQVAMAHNVPRLVMISSDKAVNPTSIMGVTKRVAELIIQDAARRSGQAYVAVRFGNVLGSRGSVVPLFESQIASGGPVTITHPEVRRYFMTIPEAVQLVLQAATFGHGGELFVLDMGEPIRIRDLAHDMIALSGLKPGEDIEIAYVGLRPGEKLFEELNVRDEQHVPSPHEKIFVLRPSQTGEVDGFVDLQQSVAALIAAASAGDTGEISRLLHALVPEYREMSAHAVVAEPV
ncbi:MAG: polysaccharide biosynthesis protein [Chloroflexi bacterium]|nr:polysaccharide biosynthesis protein [Chloroflexota bacterium]